MLGPRINVLLAILVLFGTNSCGIFDNCEELDNRFSGYYLINTDTGEHEFYPLSNHDSFLSDANLSLTNNGNIWFTSVYGNQLIDPRSGKVLLSINEDQPVLTLPSSDNLYFAENTYRRFNYNDDLTTNNSLPDSAFIYSINKENGVADTLFWLSRELKEPDKLLLRSIYLPVESFVNDKNGYFAILDEETKVLTTDSLKTVLSVNQFHFERNFVFIDAETHEVEKLMILGNELESYVAFENPSISEDGGLIAYESSNQMVTVIDPVNNWFREYNGGYPVLSNNRKYLAVSDRNSRYTVYDLEVNEEIELERSHINRNVHTPGFTIDSQNLLISDLFYEDNLEYGRVWMQSVDASEEYYSEIVDTRDLIERNNYDLMRSSISQAVQLNESEFIVFANISVNIWCD